VYARRFESRKTCRSGYAPACANEWVRGVCDKPRIKCGECPNRRFLPVTDEVVGHHLSGWDDQGRAFVMGICPTFLDDACYFVAVGFGKRARQADAGALLETRQRLVLPGVPERSRSGQGGHVWLFFDGALPTVLARNLASHIRSAGSVGFTAPTASSSKSSAALVGKTPQMPPGSG
jgi:hypothetical protein